jgi:hypothetical protein
MRKVTKSPGFIYLDSEAAHFVLKNGFTQSPYNHGFSLSFYSKSQKLRLSDHWQNYPSVDCQDGEVLLCDISNYSEPVLIKTFKRRQVQGDTIRGSPGYFLQAKIAKINARRCNYWEAVLTAIHCNKKVFSMLPGPLRGELGNLIGDLRQDYKVIPRGATPAIFRKIYRRFFPAWRALPANF